MDGVGSSSETIHCVCIKTIQNLILMDELIRNQRVSDSTIIIGVSGVEILLSQLSIRTPNKANSLSYELLGQYQYGKEKQ